MGRILNSKGDVQYTAKGKPVSQLAKNKGVTTSTVPSYASYGEFADKNPMAAKIAGGIFPGIKDIAGGGAPDIGRLFGAGITKGASANKKGAAMSTSYPVVGNKNSDHRVRLSLPPKSKILYNGSTGGLIAPLAETNGVVFPYTPAITFQHQVDYSRTSPTHSNYPFNFYSNSAVQDILITGTFTVDSGPDAIYVMAVIQFLRTITKMFGEADGALAGNPPPIMRLSGHGQHLMPNIPCVVNNVSITLPAEVDYMAIPGLSAGGFDSSPGTTRVPRQTEISVGVTPVYSRNQLREFGLDTLASGAGSSKGFI